MRVLVATQQMQGERHNDFYWCDEGELVTFDPLHHDGEEVDGSCGCRRSMAGTRTFRPTTTIKVAESDLTKQEYIDFIVDVKDKQGWGGPYERWAPEIDVLLGIAEQYPVGTVLERRGDIIQVRQKSVDVIQMEFEARDVRQM